MALYRHNHAQIQGLEAELARYGYRDLFAPLPPECPLDMLELQAAGAGRTLHAQGQGAHARHPEGRLQSAAACGGWLGNSMRCSFGASL